MPISSRKDIPEPGRNMLEQIDLDIIHDIANVCAWNGRELRPERLSRKRYYAGGGNFSCQQIDARGSFIWFCAAAGLVLDGITLDADAPDALWRDLLARRAHGINPSSWRRKVRPGSAAAGPRAASSKSSARRADRTTPHQGPAGEEWIATRICEIVADIRRIAAARGLSSPAMLQWVDYRVDDGRFTRKEIGAVSSWGALCAAADAVNRYEAVAA